MPLTTPRLGEYSRIRRGRGTLSRDLIIIKRNTTHTFARHAKANAEFDWQPGVTPGNENLRPFIDGQPIFDAIGAKLITHWDDQDMPVGFVRCYQRDAKGEYVKTLKGNKTVDRTGYVELRECDRG